MTTLSTIMTLSSNAPFYSGSYYGTHAFQETPIHGQTAYVSWLEEGASEYTAHAAEIDLTTAVVSNTQQLFGVGEQDAHNYPRLALDAIDQRIVASYSLHNDDLFVQRSLDPLSYSSFQPKETWSYNNNTYPFLFSFPDGRTLLCARNNPNRLTVWWKDNWGTLQAHWAVVLAAGHNCYLSVGQSRNDNLHAIWTDYSGGGTPANFHRLEYIRSEDGGRTWLRVDGAAHPLNSPNGSVIESGDGYMVGSATEHGAQVPLVLYTHQPNSGSSIWFDTELWMARYTGTWEKTKLSDIQGQRPQVVAAPSGDCFVYASKYDSSGVAQVSEWRISPSGDFAFEQVLSESPLADAQWPAVASNPPGNQWTVSWTEGSAIKARTVTDGAAPAPPAWQLSNADAPWGNSDFRIRNGLVEESYNGH